MKTCSVCGDGFDDDQMATGDVCRRCEGEAKFAAFARSCGLSRYPDPTGERYVNRLDGSCAGKKSECIDFMEELWDALVRAKGGGEDLLLGKE